MRALALWSLVLLAGCSSEPPPAPQPTTSPTPTPRPTPSPRALKPGELPTPELDGATPLAGDWRYQASASGSAVRYESNGGASFTVRCDPQARRIIFGHPGQGRTIRLYVADAAATFPTQTVDGAAEAAVTTGQTFLDALARADTIGLQVDDGAVAQLPGDKAIGTVVQGCRPGLR
ncbi:hypothetical protein [Sphingomonas sp. Leaf10]|uniref:hypothetical protein n=1 Tax=Sphingomonas sp. Leaf10 TaxID=1735676 RepID=UPI0006F281CF|nr:hypothetical protein [Sphingomonas sp. Leaf10]KQM37599.1 hypothetical protein ASE59_14020 [Sphingomonas sp. Leaf10]